MGLAIDKDNRDLSYIGHGGSITGFESQAVWYPDARGQSGREIRS
jgi:hypothetical protein